MLVCGLSTMVGIMEGSNIRYILPKLQHEMNCSHAQGRILSSVGYFGIQLSLLVWGVFADTWGRREVILTSMAGTFVCSLLSAFAFNVNFLILIRFIGGISYVLMR